MAAEALAQLSPDAGAPWTWFHATGSVEELAVCLNRLRAKGWAISDEPPVPGPFGSWDVAVRPPVR
ncbi:MAG: hypothetical protein QOE05_3210 [Actinomycetota bacterium]|jgi:hypothetical protein|nr:hypothetical protein [Actinomycetota bacterium]